MTSSQSRARLAGRQPPPIPQSDRKRGRPCTPLIPVDEAGLGPAMLALSPTMRAFVVAKIQSGCSNADAARLAGYSAVSPHALEVTGSRLAHDERIQAALLEEGQKLMRTQGPKSILTLVEIRDNKSLDAKDRAKAAVELLNRSGFQATTTHQINVEHTHLTDGQKDARIIELCRELGLPETEARKMLIAPDKIIEGEFTEAEPVGPPTEIAAKRQRKTELERERRKLTPEELAARKAANLEAQKERRRRAEEARALAAGAIGLEDILGLSDGEEIP